jgi:nucleoside 2-deoxyribosyltransferase
MLIYVAGPIRPKGNQTLEGNLEQAKKIAYELWSKGYSVICPHANTDLTDEIDWEMDWLKGDLEMLARCDAMVVCPDYKESVGTTKEILFAHDKKIPVYFYPDIPEIYATETKYPIQCQSFMDTIMSMYRVHLRKNCDYSPANIKGTGELGVVVRLWDKVARLMNLTGFKVDVITSSYGKPQEPKNESIDDAYMDLSVYGIIGMLVRKDAWGK